MLVLNSNISPFFVLIAVDPTTAPELFMSMAHTPDCDKVQRALAMGPSPQVPQPPLDPRAVAAVALRSLATLGPEVILTPEESANMISPFLDHGNDLVRASVAMHQLSRLPPRRKELLRRLLRYLKRLALFSDVCSVAGLSMSVGPALFQPEKLPMATGAVGLMNAAVQCANLLIR